MSARRSTGSPLACSGLDARCVTQNHAGLGVARPAVVEASVSCADKRSPIQRFRDPEVEDLHCSVAAILMFAGFRSRWMTRCSCAASSASAICFAMGRLHRAACPCGRRCNRSSPSPSSITSAAIAPLFPARGSREVRIIEGGEHFRLALKTGEPLGVRRDRGRQNLDGDLTFQPGVDRPKHLAHPAFANSKLRLRKRRGACPE